MSGHGAIAALKRTLDCPRGRFAILSLVVAVNLAFALLTGPLRIHCASLSQGSGCAVFVPTEPRSLR